MAEHLLLGRKVALKRLHPELAKDEKAVARFQREARAAAATGHEHIVEVLDLGYAEDGAPFLVMEYLRGRSLSTVLEQEGPLEPARACRIVGQMLAALAAVHDHGIVHRDLKPDNILLTRRRGDPEFVKVLDFGISKMRPAEGEQTLHLTRTGVMLGTPFYMSPEQARGIKDLDHRVDLFGAGVMLYEALGGRLPFDGENYHQLLQSILRGAHDPIGEVRPELDPDLAAVVERAIALDPTQRYATARDMLVALVPHGAVDRGPPGEGGEPAADAGPTLATRAWTWPPRTEPPHEPPLGDARTPSAGAASRVMESRPRHVPHPRGLAPPPGPPASRPRRFVAQSPDWDPTLADPVTSSGARQRLSHFPPPTPAPATSSVSARLQSSRPGISHPPQAAETVTRVKASLLLSATEHLKRRDGGLEAVLQRLREDVAQRLTTVMLPMAWIDLADYAELLRAAERELGTGEGTLSIQIGQATADHELSRSHRSFMRSATPRVAVERIPQLFRTYHSNGTVRVDRATAGGYRVETTELDPDTLPHALALSGFYQRLIELAGGRDVRASVVSCRERGDDATVTVLRWR